MSTNIQGLIDRTYREYLEPMDDLQPYTLLTSGLTDSADTVSFNGDLLTQEEFDNAISVTPFCFKAFSAEATSSWGGREVMCCLIVCLASSWVN